MKIFLKSIALRFSAMVCLFSITIGNAAVAAGWYTATINRIQVGEDKRVSLVANSSDPVNECGTHGLEMNDPASPGASWILASLFTNQLRGRKVQFYIVTCTGSNIAKFDKIEDID